MTSPNSGARNRPTSDSDNSVSESSNLPLAKRTALPKFQVFLTLIIQAMEPIAATVIYAFITQAIRLTGITHGDEKKTGYWAGVLVGYL